MPLLNATLLNATLDLVDSQRSSFVGWPDSIATAAQNWAGVATRYFDEAVNPPLATASPITAETAFVAVVTSTVVSPMSPTAFIALDSAFTAYVTTRAALVVQLTPGSAVVPPAGLPGLAATTFAPTSDASVFANVFTSIIDTWSRRGTWTPNVAAGASFPWS